MQKRQLALTAAVNGDWAIEPEWIPRILEIAGREHAGLQAVQAERGEDLEYTYTATIRDGVAIIPITGPIFRYANLFSYYSGGTSVSLIARDFNACLNDPRVDSILFEINSPGGEVTGINELAEMIYKARGRKPITARVGGHGCSAAYWILSACGDVVIDETAALGSIGVYAAFRDTSKRDAKEGVREIKIISNQSPDKAHDPASAKGAEKIQARVDQLAQIFIEKVARNRDVTVEKVLADFGQGDVLLGEDAVAAGLADRLGSFEETLAELAAAHGPARGGGFTGALHAEEGETVTDEPRGDVHASPEARDTPPRLEGQEDAAPVEEESPTCPEHPDGCPEGEPCEEEANSAHAPVTQDRGETDMADENKSGAAGTAQPTIEQLQTELKALQARDQQRDAEMKAAGERVATLEAEARTGRLRALAAGFSGTVSEKVSFMEKLAASFGEDSDELEAYVTDQNALAEQVRAGGVFNENGSGANGAGEATAAAKLHAEAVRIAETNNLPYAQAYLKAVEANPALYDQHVAEKR